ncbi:MAG TPA: WD40 repeat domain-containing protein [Blastocatellia bacterium]|nr:WD40 repeat domain-containing protein [Blastocatellia bacterium]
MARYWTLKYLLIISASVAWMAGCRERPKTVSSPVDVPPVTIAPPPPVEPNVETLVNRAGTLCEGAFSSRTAAVSAGLRAGTLTPGSLLVVRSGSSAAESSWSHRPIILEGASSEVPFLEAPTARDVKCLVCIREIETLVGSYTDGSPAYRVNWLVRLVREADGEVLAQTSLAGRQPPRKIYRSADEGARAVHGDDQRKALFRWLAAGFEPGQVLWLDGEVKSFSLAPDGKTVATLIGAFTKTTDRESRVSFGSEDRLEVWDLTTGRKKAAFGTREKSVYSVALSPDGRTLAAGVSEESEGLWADATVKLWDVASGKELRALRGHAEPVDALAFSPDGALLATGSRDRTVKTWSLATGEEVSMLAEQLTRSPSLAFAPDGRTLATDDQEKSIVVWDLSTGKPHRVLRGHTGGATGLAFSRDGRTLVSGSFDKTANLWDLETGEVVRTFTGHAEGILAIALSPDGTTLAAGGSDHTIKLWELSSGKAVRTLRGHMGSVVRVAYSPDGRSLVSGSRDATIRVWNLSGNSSDSRGVTRASDR